MARLVSISRAAKLVGVPRGTLQQRIQQGEIASFEGKLSLTELARAYPNAQFEDNSMLERIEQIIETAARNARVRSVKTSPDLETLAARVNILSDELAWAKLEISNYLNIFDKLKSRLLRLAQTHSQVEAEIIELRLWLLNQLHPAEPLPPPVDHGMPLLAVDTLLSIITAQVRLEPSGHEFLIEGNNSILESGLSAGLALNYGCSNGNCGKCKARVISGQVRKIRPHDYLLSEAEKLHGTILTCSYTAVTDIVLDAEEAGTVGDIPHQSITARVRKLVPINADVHVLHVKTPRTQRLRFLAGQKVNLSIPDLGDQPFHIASCPCDDMHLQFHIQRDDDDPLVQHLFDALNPNDTLQIEGPHGNFVLHEDSTTPIMFIAFGTGFAPIKGLIEHAVTLDAAQSLHLYWVASHKDKIYLENQCRAWSDALETFHYTPMISHGDSNKAASDLVTQLMQDYPSLSNMHYYIAGDSRVINCAQEALVKHGAERNWIFTEAM
ncbi:MAG: 2Fe-2S iron-sulfur cluster binding domain-containing protein [Gammaproteobacteria bacterium]|nr:2Fe-2S iron-sulfur cluster binding domain-containing protein [Gammaproteobacteria bacterium]